VVRDYLAEIARLVAGSMDFEALAHIDFVSRYWPAAAGPFDPADFEEEFRLALTVVAAAGLALEVNTNRRPFRSLGPFRVGVPTGALNYPEALPV